MSPRLKLILDSILRKQSDNPQQKVAAGPPISEKLPGLVRADVDVTRFGDQPNIDREYLDAMTRGALKDQEV